MDGVGANTSHQNNHNPVLLQSSASASLDHSTVTDKLVGYEFQDKIGEGGMATVYRGLQLSLQRPVAIKILNQQLVEHNQVLESFEREAVIIARLNHPNIIHVIDRGIIADGCDSNGQPYFIMEYIDGIDLGELMAQGSLPLQKKIEICLQICRALSYAHKNGIVHRDIKPGNILIDSDFNIKILDFGIALFYNDEANEQSELVPESEAQAIMGTYNYMAPEMSTSAVNATAQSDIYSLGVIMYELFAGQFPHHSQRLKTAAESPLPNSVAKLIMQCMALEPHLRPQSMSVIYDQLLILLRGAHLDKRKVKQANESVNSQKTFSLLDIIREGDDSSVYLFIERQRGQQFVIRKMAIGAKGYESAKSLSKLSHPNLARVHGVSKNKRAFIQVMDYQRGGNLKERLVKPVSVEEFIKIARQICQGLGFAHQHNIAHGNLHPGNILFDENNSAKISDFGLSAHDIESDDKQTAMYRVEGEPTCPQADLYALGVIFYQLLLGEYPHFKNDQLHNKRRLVRLPIILQELLRGLLQRNLSHRYTDVTAVIEQLNKMNEDLPTQVWQSESAMNVESVSSGNKAIAFCCAGIAAFSVAAYWLWQPYTWLLSLYF